MLSSYTNSSFTAHFILLLTKGFKMSNKKKHRNRARRETKALKSLLLNSRFGKLGNIAPKIAFDDVNKSDSERLQAVKDFNYYLKGFQK